VSITELGVAMISSSDVGMRVVLRVLGLLDWMGVVALGGPVPLLGEGLLGAMLVAEWVYIRI
jgi:hypothetical protein